MTKHEAKRRARILLTEAQKGSLDSAHVLADTLVYAGHPQLGEDLALTLSGRAVGDEWSHTLGRHLERGEALLGDRGPHVLSVMKRIKTALSPPRRSACLPNRKAFIRLVEQTHGSPLDEDSTRIARRIWKALTEACEFPNMQGTVIWRRVERALSIANDGLAGHGVEHHYGLIDYVNMGDSYVPTLMYVSPGPGRENEAKFRVASLGDVVEEIERRQRRPRRRRRRVR